jgi:hypothetical protein
MVENRALMQQLQNLEDDLDLDEVVETDTVFREHFEIRTQMLEEDGSEGGDGLHYEVAFRVFAAGHEDKVIDSTFYGDSP